MNDKKKSISNPKIAESSVMELKNIILMLNQKIDKLTESHELYKTEMREKFNTFAADIKEIKKQNFLVLNSLGENTVAIKTSLKDRSPRYTKTFPIKTLEEFNKLENTINETNENEYIASIRAIVGRRGIKKGLCKLVEPDVLTKFNLHGIKNKLRILNYTKFCNILLAGTYDEACTQKAFEVDLREALRVAKNRKYKENMTIKKKSTQDTSDNSNLQENECVATENTIQPKTPEVLANNTEDFFQKHMNDMLSN